VKANKKDMKNISYICGMRVFLILVLSIFFSITAVAQQNSGFTMLIPGIGFDDVKVGQTTREEIIKKYGEGFKIDTFYSVDSPTQYGRTIIVKGVHSKRIYSIRLSYDILGLSFYFRPHDDFIFEIDAQYPCQAKTKEGIILNKSSFSDVNKIYGVLDWSFMEEGKSLYDMALDYDSLGIEFSQAFNGDLPVSDDKLKPYLHNKITVIKIVPVELDDSGEEGK